jgi:hypothetical protein
MGQQVTEDGCTEEYRVESGLQYTAGNLAERKHIIKNSNV